MLVAGFMLNQRDPAAAVHTPNRVLQFIAPPVAQYEHLAQPRRRGPDGGPRPPRPPGPSPALVQLINSFVAGSRSGAAGVVGALPLILIVIQLFTSVENAFNAVWGVRRGRSWLLRIVFYWTIVTLGTVLFFASLTALSAAAFISVFFEKTVLRPGTAVGPAVDAARAFHRAAGGGPHPVLPLYSQHAGLLVGGAGRRHHRHRPALSQQLPRLPLLQARRASRGASTARSASCRS